ncbi:hypothetical protein [Paraburkholderia sp. LEh10]|nr:hypothetical protein [Paraburkholderia sp. LEh10]
MHTLLRRLGDRLIHAFHDLATFSRYQPLDTSTVLRNDAQIA